MTCLSVCFVLVTIWSDIHARTHTCTHTHTHTLARLFVTPLGMVFLLCHFAQVHPVAGCPTGGLFLAPGSIVEVRDHLDTTCTQLATAKLLSLRYHSKVLFPTTLGVLRSLAAKNKQYATSSKQQEAVAVDKTHQVAHPNMVSYHMLGLAYCWNVPWSLSKGLNDLMMCLSTHEVYQLCVYWTKFGARAASCNHVGPYVSNIHTLLGNCECRVRPTGVNCQKTLDDGYPINSSDSLPPPKSNI